MRAVLALDQGGHASRACLVDVHGRILATQQVPIATAHGSAGEVEHDPQEIVASLQAAAAGVLRAAPELIVDAAGLATQRSTIVCFERGSGVALSSAISWQDRRNEPWLASFAPHAARIAELTGLPLSPHYGVGKMRWCLDHLPAVQRARARGELIIAPLAAYLAMRLTGGAALADPANASRTLLFDSAQRDWSAELLRLFGIERAWLPACTPTRTRHGVLRLGEAAARSQPIELRAVTGDQSAIPFAFGAPDNACVYINLGTGAFLQRPLSVRPTDAAPLLASVLLSDRDHALYSLEGTVNGAGAAISRFAADSGVPESSLWRELEQRPPGGALPVYINAIGGLGSPYWRAEQRSYFIGEGSTLERFAAVVESILFLIAINFDLMRHRGGALARVIASGGLSRSDWLCRRLAALLGAPVLRGAQEATVLGVAALAAPELFGDARERRAQDSAEQRFEPGLLPPAELAALAARRSRFDAALSP
ncbi:MAG: FGGY family carbohydrate kinase [Steroidobacterales bacterium]